MTLDDLRAGMLVSHNGYPGNEFYIIAIVPTRQQTIVVAETGMRTWIFADPDLISMSFIGAPEPSGRSIADSFGDIRAGMKKLGLSG